MTFYQLVKYCVDSKISLSVGENDELKINGNPESLSTEIIGEIRKYKDQFICKLKSEECDSKSINKHMWRYGELSPLSFSQQRIYRSEMLAKGSPINNIAISMRIFGLLNIKLAIEILDYLIDRHKVLKYTYVEKNGNIYQTLKEDKFSIVSFEKVPNINDQFSIEKVKQFISTPFNLECQPSIRVNIQQDLEGNSRLTWVLHHISADGWSLSFLASEFSRLYNSDGALLNKLPKIDLEYRDYAVWENTFSKSPNFDKALEFWSNYLLDSKSFIPPKPNKNIQVSNSKNCIENQVVDDDLTKKVRSLGRKLNISTHYIMETLFSWALSLFNDTDYVIFATPVTLRDNDQLTDVVGCCVNTIIRKLSTVNDINFYETVFNNAHSMGECLTNSLIPFEKQVEFCLTDNEVLAIPCFFNMQRFQESDFSLNNFRSEFENLFNLPDTFLFSLDVLESSNNFSLNWKWNSELVSMDFVHQIINIFSNLLRVVVDNPYVKLRDAIDYNTFLSIKTGSQKQWKFNSFVDRFEFVARKFPENIALLFGDTKYTYSELDKISTRIAILLRNTFGVTSGTRIAIALPRSDYFVIFQLSILKAGGIFIPFDIDLDQIRMPTYLNESCAEFAIVEDIFENSSETSFILLSEIISKLSITNISEFGSVHYQDAYIVFTSGTTGTPKGVLNTNLGLLNLAMSQSEMFSVNSNSRIFHFASLGFDAQISEWSMAWASGAALVIPDNKLLRTDPQLFSSFCNEKKISHVTLPPTFLRYLKPSDFSTVKHVISAGETCDSFLVDRWYRDFNFYNAYGPSEVSVCSSINHVNKLENNVSIGDPIYNTSIAIMNEEDKILPLGILGEICIFGFGVSRGYINSDFETKTKFKFSDIQSMGKVRFYKTGDLGYLDSSRNLYCVGRADDQIKISGRRIEISEIRHLLLSIDHVLDAQVIFDSESELLHAFIIPNNIDTSKLIRKRVDNVIPSHLQPNIYHFVDKFNLNVNGKVDIKSLIDLLTSYKESFRGGNILQNQDNTNNIMINLWKKFFLTEDIDIFSDFFDLGGQSIMAIKLAGLIEAEFGVSLTIEEIYLSPTVKALADLVGKKLSNENAISSLCTFEI
ncbi:AMP-binding protein [Microbulbifer sp. CnH-101-G]|uniref:AMP-binding protein n=1 Tax=Microbulbifer sp. CnH-101-G TaxID=3243393 RepID=UPI00403A6D04